MKSLQALSGPQRNKLPDYDRALTREELNTIIAIARDHCDDGDDFEWLYAQILQRKDEDSLTVDRLTRFHLSRLSSTRSIKPSLWLGEAAIVRYVLNVCANPYREDEYAIFSALRLCLSALLDYPQTMHQVHTSAAQLTIIWESAIRDVVIRLRDIDRRANTINGAVSIIRILSDLLGHHAVEHFCGENIRHCIRGIKAQHADYFSGASNQSKGHGDNPLFQPFLLDYIREKSRIRAI